MLNFLVLFIYLFIFYLFINTGATDLANKKLV